MLQKTGEKEETLFIGRNSTISQLKDSLSKNRTAALLANSGYGRTALLKHFAKDNNAAYIDLRKLSLSPESFAVDLLNTICFQNLAKTQSEKNNYQTISDLKQLKLKDSAKKIINTIDNELQKIKPDQDLVIRSAFAFAEEFAKENNKQTIILNNFEEIIKLNNFSGIKDILSIFFNTISNNKNASFMVASSAVQVMKSLLKKHPADVFELAPFDLKDTKELFEKIAGKTDDRIIKEAYKRSAGIPLIIKRIALRFRGEKTADTQKNISLINYILLSDLTTSTSPTQFYCSRLFATSLSRARGESLLKTVLKVVSRNKPLRLSELARQVYRSGPVTKSLLERLIEVDLITKTDSTFDFTNPVLRLWCNAMFNDIEFNVIPDENTLKQRGLL
jgi:hypothetical protein